ncbi:MAG: hypothetical protein AAGC79_11840 [Pseudomonadota bacterium]
MAIGRPLGETVESSVRQEFSIDPILIQNSPYPVAANGARQSLIYAFRLKASKEFRMRL